MTEYSNLISDTFGQQQQVAQQHAVGNINEDPDRATRAIELGQAWGVSPSVVHADLDGFEEQQKANIASSVVQGNPQLQSYILKDPMAPKVSNDDYGNLDALGDAVRKHNKDSVLANLPTDFMEGFGKGGLGSWLKSEDWEKNRLGAAAWSVLGSPVEGMFRIGSGVITAGIRAFEHAAVQAGVDPVEAKGKADDAIQVVGDPGMWASLGAVGEAIGTPFALAAHNAMLKKAARIGPYVENGKIPPVGVDEITDSIHKEQAKADADTLKEMLKASADTLTRERSPDHLHSFLNEFDNIQGHIGISADAIRTLYGDKIPSPDDGVVGWIPQLQEQLQVAAQSGGDVEVPFSMYLAKIDPKVAKELENHVRLRPEGMTEEEAKQPITPPAKISLNEISEGPESVQHADMARDMGIDPGTPHVFEIAGPEKKGLLYVREIDEGKRLYIDDVRGDGLRPNSLGPRGIRDILQAIGERFPNAETILGDRISGARKDQGATPLVEVKIPRPSVAEDTMSAVRDASRLDSPVRPQQLELPVEGTTRIEDADTFQGAAPGLTKKQTLKYQALIEKKVAEDQDFLQKKLEEQETRRRSKAYRERKIEIRPQVVEDLNALPEHSLLRDMDEGTTKLQADYFTEEQRKLLPKDWLAKDGIHPDDLAHAYGVDSTTELLSKFYNLYSSRKTANMRPEDFRRRLIDQEIERRVGDEFKGNYLEEVKDHVLSETQEEMLHEQTMALAEAAGQQYPIDPKTLREQHIEAMKQLPITAVSKDKFLAEAGRAGRALEDAALKGDIAEQFRQSQRQQFAFMAARYAKEVEKAKDETTKIAKRYSKREVKGQLPEYTNAIHSILAKVGQPIGRLPADLAREMAAGEYKDLKEFVERKEDELAVAGIELPVADFLLDENFRKTIDQMSTFEFLGLHQSLKSLDHFGREENKVLVAGEKMDRKDWVADAVKQLEEKFDPRPTSVQKPGITTRFAKQFVAALHSVETVFRRFDGRDPKGTFTKTFVYEAAKALNDEDRLQREIAKEYRAVGKVEDPTKPVTHNFVDPLYGNRFKGFNRETLEAIVANIGNGYNLDRMAYTLGMFEKDEKGKVIFDRQGLLDWVEANTKAEDIARAQERGKILSRLKKQSDTVYRNIYGVAPEDIVTTPFQMHGQTWDGWYHPIIQDAERAIRDHQRTPDEVTKPTSFWPSPANSYTKSRSGALERLSLNMAQVPLELAKVIHDIAVRDFVNNSSKLINDSEFRLGVTKFYGKEYHDLMKNWLYNIAGNSSYSASALSAGTKFSNMLRQNVISTYIAFNLGTVYKHAPTAAVMSMKEMGSAKGALSFLANTAAVVPQNFAHNVMGLLGRDPALGESMWQFAVKHSEELQRRDRNWMETMAGAHEILFGKPTLRNKIMQWGAKAVALSDMASAVPLWYTKYHEVLAETGEHGPAVMQADLAVRNAHGSTSAASRPAISSAGGALAPWLTSLYGFFGANMQRKIEILHDLNDTYKLAREGEIKAAASNIPGISASVAAYVIFPALVEEWVTGQFTDDRRGLLEKAASFTLLALSNSIIGLREVAWGFGHGQEPSAGLFTGPLHDLANLKRSVTKPRAFGKENAGKLVQDSLTVFGDTTGMMPKPIARATRYGIDVYNNKQTPRNYGDWYRGILSGQQKVHVER